MKRLAVFGAFLAIISVARSQSCDEANGWTELNGKCFRVSGNAAETQQTWYEARQSCATEGGDLATFTSLEEQMFVVNKALAIGYTGSLWHGLNQLDDKYFGEFKWADGSNSTYRNWAVGEPKDSGVSNCAFTITEEAASDFTRYDYSSSTQGLLEPGYDHPSSADGIDTFYFGTNWEYDQTWCEEQCRAKEECAAYTWYPYHWDYYWDYTCVGRSDRYDILGYDAYGYAGVREVEGDDSGEAWWQTGNCGLRMAFACVKPIGSSETPITPAPTASVDGYCPEGYIGTTNKCLRVVTITEELQGFYWSQAVNLCRQGPGIAPDLASIHSEEEQSLIAQELQGLSYGVWIGYHYVTNFDQWVWADNSETQYENWGANSPGDLTSLCTEMAAYTGAVGDWRNTNCATKKGFVCQTYKDPNNIIENPPATTPHSCPSGWTPYWYGCYYFDSTQRSWTSARDNCESLGGSLVSIHSEAENAAVHVMAKSFPSWIGLRANEEGDYEWVDGWPYGFYTNWNEDAGVGEGCVAMQGSSMWADTTCGNTYTSVCKITDESPPSTPSGGFEEGFCPLGRWLEFGSNCYYFSDSTHDHNGAISDCRLQAGSSHDGHLATIENEYENAFITDNIRGIPDNYWIGLIRSSAGADGFIWMDGSNGQYRNWAPGEPNGPGYENCVEIFSQEYAGQWNDQRCENYDYVYNRYVCKARKGDQPTTPVMPTPGDQDCPSGNWDVWGDNCLLIRPNDYRSWDEALALCKQMGGENSSLASIHTESENYYIHAKVREYNIDEYYNPDVWIGFYKITYGYPYEWENGRAADYTNWAPGEPNDVDGSQNCVRMYALAGDWDDYYCYESFNLGYVCQVRQDLYKKELALKGPDHFLHPDDVVPSKQRHPPIDPDSARKHLKHQPPRDFIPEVYDEVEIPDANEIDQQASANDAGSSSKGNQELAIIFGSLLGVVVIVAVVSLVAMAVIDKKSKRSSAPADVNLQMENVLATPPATGEGYDQATA